MDAYSCIRYIAAYVNKSCRGVSKLLRALSKEMVDGSFNIRQQFWRYVKAVINGTEISAQEASCVLGRYFLKHLLENF
jgi:hypothetical protein